MRKAVSYRSYVSYIDKSREYYRAHGYEKPYGWAFHDEVPFAALPKPLSECRIALITTADRGGRDEPRTSKLFAQSIDDGNDLKRDKSWDRDATHTDDRETYLPISRMQEAAEAGRIGSLGPRFFGVPTDYSQRMTVEQDAPVIEAWLREDEVDAAILLPL